MVKMCAFILKQNVFGFRYLVCCLCLTWHRPSVKLSLITSPRGGVLEAHRTSGLRNNHKVFYKKKHFMVFFFYINNFIIILFCRFDLCCVSCLKSYDIPGSGSVCLLWSCMCTPADWGYILSQHYLPLLSCWIDNTVWMEMYSCRD